MNPNKSVKIGAALFVLWGVIHVLGGGMIVAAALSGPPAKALAMMGTSVNQTELATVPGGIVNAVIQFHGFNILWMGIVSIAVAIFLNWRNSRIGFWVNLAVIGFADLGLILFLIVPGYMSWSDGLIGPVLFVAGGIFTFLGLRSSSKKLPNASVQKSTV